MEKYEYPKIEKEKNNKIGSVDYWFKFATPKEFCSYNFNYGEENHRLIIIA